MIKVRSWRAAVGAGAIVATVVLGLTGCTGSGYSVLDRGAQASDTLPANFPESASGSVVPSSVRFAGMYRGDLLYAAKGVNSASYGGETVCLLVYTELSEKWSTVCGHGPVGVGDGFRDYTLRIDGAPVPEGAVRVTPNVFVIE